MTPRISIILPCFNAAAHLQEALDSLSRQTFSDFECIAIDDGSTDTTRAILESHAAKDPRFIVSSRENRGLIATLNEGIAAARGEWIARMDADDIALPPRLEKQLAHLEKTGADICGCWIRFIGDRHGEWRMPVGDPAIRFYMMFNSPLAHPTILARASLMKANPYNPEHEHAEDYGLWCTLALQGARFANVPKILLNYRTHPQQLTRSNNEALRASAERSRARYITGVLPEDLQVIAPRLIAFAEPGRVLTVDEFYWLSLTMLRLLQSMPGSRIGPGTLWLDALERTPEAGPSHVWLTRRLAHHFPLPKGEKLRYLRIVARCLLGKTLRDKLRK